MEQKIAEKPTSFSPASSKDIEDLVMVIRTYHQASKSLSSFDSSKLGAIAIFPMVFEQQFEGATHAWLATSTVEPGSILELGEHHINILLTTYTSYLAGKFSYLVSENPSLSSSRREAEYIDLEDEHDSSLHSQMPQNQIVKGVSFAELEKEVDNLAKEARKAKNYLYQIFKPFFIKEAHRVSAVSSFEDALSICYLSLEKLLSRYARSTRPKSSFRYALFAEVRRDLKRDRSAKNGESNQISDLRVVLWHNPSIKSPEELREAMGKRKVSDRSIKAALSQKPTVSLDALEVSDLLETVNSQQKLDVQVFELYDKMRTFAKVAGLSNREADIWLYRVGAFDAPHTVQDTIAHFNISISEYKTIEYRLLSPFSMPGESVASVKSRTALKKAIKMYMYDDTIVLTRFWMSQVGKEVEENAPRSGDPS
jgi:hypothetical protein